MQSAQIVAFGIEGRLGDRLRSWAEARQLAWKPTRHIDVCSSQLSHGGVFLLKVGRRLEQEMTLLSDIHREHPDSPILVIGDVDNPQLVGLAWDLGASWVAIPFSQPETLEEILANCLCPRAN